MPQIIVLGVLQSVDTNYTVAYLKHLTNFLEFYTRIDVLELLLKYVRNFACFYRHNLNSFLIANNEKTNTVRSLNSNISTSL